MYLFSDEISACLGWTCLLQPFWTHNTMAICQGDNAVANEVISQTFEAAERDTSEEVSVKKVNQIFFET